MAATIPALDLVTLLKDVPRGAWVALSLVGGAHVVAFGSEQQKVLNEAREKGETDPILIRVPESALALML
jgi:hypothetical protein